MKFKYFLLLLCVGIQPLIAQDKLSEKTFIANPYLQIGREPSAESLELLWHTNDADATWAVEEKNKNSDTWQKATEPAYIKIAVAGVDAHRIYQSKLTGLTPGSTFSYRVVKNGSIVFTSEGKAPRNDKQSFRFVAIGDIGAQTPDQNYWRCKYLKQKPDLVVVPGDICL